MDAMSNIQEYFSNLYTMVFIGLIGQAILLGTLIHALHKLRNLDDKVTRAYVALSDTITMLAHGEEPPGYQASYNYAKRAVTNYDGSGRTILK